jgi:hypothetical protein
VGSGYWGSPAATVSPASQGEQLAGIDDPEILMQNRHVATKPT